MTHSAPAMSSSPSATKAVRSSFYWAMRLMPKAQREAMYVVYGFCRAVDDIADGDETPEIKMQRLEQWRSAVEDLFGGPSDQDDLAGLKLVIESYELNKSDMLAVIDGMEMDAQEHVRIQDEAAFDLYVDRVACAVGRLSDKVFGVEGAAAEKLAHHLGRALQITNILRDLVEDAERGRLYLPQTLLQGAGIVTNIPSEALAHPNLKIVLQTLADRAHMHFAQAREALAHLDKSKTRPARIMQAVYERVLARLEARGLHNVHVPVRLSKGLKLWLALYHGVL